MTTTQQPLYSAPQVTLLVLVASTTKPSSVLQWQTGDIVAHQCNCVIMNTGLDEPSDAACHAILVKTHADPPPIPSNH